jgi:hypothetical protein
MLGACTSRTSTVRQQFVSSYSCEADKVSVSPRQATNEDVFDVVGCGKHAQYACSDATYADRGTAGGSSTVGSCNERSRWAWEATDESIHEAWGSEDWGPISRDAAIASAAHDLPCDRAAITVVGSDRGTANVLEGCGQRINYQVTDHDLATPTGHFRITRGFRFTLVGRTPIPPAH